MIVFCGDTHFRAGQPWLDAATSFTKWLHEQDWNRPDVTFVHMGDFFHSSSLTGSVAQLAVAFWNGLKCKNKIIIHGNHEYSRRMGSALLPFTELGVRVIRREELMSIDYGRAYPLNVLMLPFFYPTGAGENMKEAYQNLPMPDPKPDLIVGHFAYKELFGEEISLPSWTKGIPQLFGHVHVQDDQYIGVPMMTSVTDANQDFRLMCLDDPAKGLQPLPIPNFLELRTITLEQVAEEERALVKLNAEGRYAWYIVTGLKSAKEAATIALPVYKVELRPAEVGVQERQEELTEQSYLNRFILEKKLPARIEQKLRAAVYAQEQHGVTV